MSDIISNDVYFCAVGDLILGDSLKMVGIGVRSVIDSHGGDYLFKEISGKINCDVVFGNLETVISDIGYSKRNINRAHLRGAPLMANAIKKSGFNVINIANNHTMQFGPDPFLETCSLLTEQGIEIVGLSGENGWSAKPVIISVKGSRIGILGYAEPDNYGHKPLFAVIEEVSILKDVRRLRSMVDKVVVSLHWGDEFICCPSEDQQKLAHLLIIAGANLILGHHPHVIQRIETYNEGIICYSLGNFISDMLWNHRTSNGLLVKFEINSSRYIKIHSVKKIKNCYNYVPSIEEFSLEKVNQICALDEEQARFRGEYKKMCRMRYLENRNLAHVFLFRNFVRYSFLIFLQICWKSFVSMMDSVFIFAKKILLLR